MISKVFKKKNFFFTFGCTGPSLLCVGFLQLQRAGATPCSGIQASHCCGFSCFRAWALEHGLSNCGAWASLLHGMWDLPEPGTEPMFPALASEFLSTLPPGMSSGHFLIIPFPDVLAASFGITPSW